MAGLTPSGSPSGNLYADMRILKWSPTEKAIARKAFDAALQREFDAVIVEVKKRAGKIQQPGDLWDLEDYLGKARKWIDDQYDYRYSVLPVVFARLIREGKLSEQELKGLGEDKLEQIRRIASFVNL